MSDDDRDIDIDIDSDDDDLKSNQYLTESQKRAHHNALERKRRDHIKESFSSLRDSIPTLRGEKVSRAQILKKATDYIMNVSKRNDKHQNIIDDIAKQNSLLEIQIKKLQKEQGISDNNDQCSDSKTSDSSSDNDEIVAVKQDYTISNKQISNYNNRL